MVAFCQLCIIKEINDDADDLPNSQLPRLQHIENSLARAVFVISSITPLLFWNLSTDYKSTNVSNIRFSLSSSSLVHPHLPLSKSQIALSGMHHPVFGIIFLLRSVNLVHHLSPPSHHPSLPLSSIPDLRHTCSTNLSHHTSSPAHWTSTGLP